MFNSFFLPYYSGQLDLCLILVQNPSKGKPVSHTAAEVSHDCHAQKLELITRYTVPGPALTRQVLGYGYISKLVDLVARP